MTYPVKLFTKPDTKPLEFNHTVQAMSYADFRNITKFSIVKNLAGYEYAVYCSSNQQWYFKATEAEAVIFAESLI